MSDDSTLSHLDADGRARMVDVSGKSPSVRRAVASGRYRTRADVIALLRDDALPKADVLTTARLAGIGGAKRTSELIPLCHPLPLDAVTVDLELDIDSVVITATATTTGRTGVEMEALTAVAVAGLTLHDMVKAVDPAGVLGEIRLIEKTGGVRGPWSRDVAARPAAARANAGAKLAQSAPEHPAVRPRTAIVLVASTRAASGERPDETGPVIAAWLGEHGIAVDEVVVAPDAGVAEALQAALASAPAVILTTGGTGPSPSDRTPDAVAAEIDVELPGIAEAIRARGREAVPTAALSRGVAGIARGTVIVTLPGSRGGVRDGLAVLDELLPHLLEQLAGGDHDA
ncbi:bifunctional molybdenum cofactor biosynthesis protein MoaC/MoaB [Microcella sp.]|uniref:bifunctional molybdenum cofactor biosynthesis protein MoaC/MoaB n=1 Tax=Microcella sp. TaxID=1913979 RepID=UPI00391CF72C